MRINIWLAFVLGFAGCLVAHAPDLAALEGSPFDTDPRDPVEVAVERWEQTINDIKTLDLRFLCKSFDETFGTVSIMEGRFYFEAPDRAYFAWEPSTVAPARIGKYKVESGNAEAWTWTGSHLFLCTELAEGATAQKCTMQESPEKVVGWDFGTWLTPQFCCPMFLDAAVIGSQITFQRVARKQDRHIQLYGQPNSEQVRSRFNSCDVILDTTTNLPLAYQTIDPAGNRRTLFLLKDVKTNFPIDGASSPIETGLRRFREIEGPATAPTPAETAINVLSPGAIERAAVPPRAPAIAPRPLSEDERQEAFRQRLVRELLWGVVF